MRVVDVVLVEKPRVAHAHSGPEKCVELLFEVRPFGIQGLEKTDRVSPTVRPALAKGHAELIDFGLRHGWLLMSFGDFAHAARSRAEASMNQPASSVMQSSQMSNS